MIALGFTGGHRAGVVASVLCIALSACHDNPPIIARKKIDVLKTPVRVRGGATTIMSHSPWTQKTANSWCVLGDTSRIYLEKFIGADVGDFPRINLSPTWAIKIFGSIPGGKSESINGVMITAVSGTNCGGGAGTTGVTLRTLHAGYLSPSSPSGPYLSNLAFADTDHACSVGSHCEYISRATIDIPANPGTPAIPATPATPAIPATPATPAKSYALTCADNTSSSPCELGIGPD